MKKPKLIKNSKNADNFPSGPEFERIRDMLSDPNYEGGSLALSPDASETDKAKYQLCQLILIYKRKNNVDQNTIADLIGVDKSRISEILRMRFASFTLDRLIAYAEKLHPKLKITIKAA